MMNIKYYHIYACFKDGWMVCYQFSKLVITIIMYLDNHDYKNHDDLIVITKNNHDISIFNDNCPALHPKSKIGVVYAHAEATQVLQ